MNRLIGRRGGDRETVLLAQGFVQPLPEANIVLSWRAMQLSLSSSSRLYNGKRRWRGKDTFILFQKCCDARQESFGKVVRVLAIFWWCRVPVLVRPLYRRWDGNLGCTELLACKGCFSGAVWKAWGATIRTSGSNQCMIGWEFAA